MPSVAQIDGLNIPGGAPAFTGLLDETYGSGAAAAYSVRRLASATTVLLRVRRDTAGGTGDEDEADVAYDSNNILSLESPVNNFSATSNAINLGQFLNATGYNDADGLTVVADGFIDSWYDQSGNNLDAAQSIFSEQPQIFDSAAATDLIKINGKPSIYFNKTLDNNLVTPSSSWSSAGDMAIFCAWERDTVSGAAEVWSNVGVRWFGGQGASQVYVAPSALAYGQPTVQNLFSYEHRDGVSKTIYIDGAQEATASTPGAVPTTSSISRFGRRYNGAESWTPMYQQEFIHYPSDQSSNRTDIEENINAEYLIYQPTTQPTSGLLYDYGSATGGTDAAAAYSVRQLSDKAVICMRIRRDMGPGNPGDDDEINIGFDANGDLDTAAISAFCGTGTGFVTRWWDQSVNGNHADQPVGGTGSNGDQPQIYNGTAVITDNGKPAIDILSGDSFEVTSISLNAYFSTSFVINPDVTGGMLLEHGAAGAAVMYLYGTTGATFNLDRNVIDKYNATSTWIGTSQTLITLNSDGTPTLHKDGTSVSLTPISVGGVNNTSVTAALSLFSRGGTALFYEGKTQELIIWNVDQSSNRTGIETNIDTYYQIP